MRMRLKTDFWNDLIAKSYSVNKAFGKLGELIDARNSTAYDVDAVVKQLEAVEERKENSVRKQLRKNVYRMGLKKQSRL